MTISVNTWWLLLRIAAIFSCAAWLVSAFIMQRCRNNYSSKEYQWRRWLVMLSACYMLGCAFRSFLPRIDLQRICLVQSWLSRMVVGRSVATIAELCFMAQCALLLYIAGRATGSKFTIRISQLLLPLIVVAECASWYAILSTNYFGHAFENSIWTFCGMLLLASFFFLWPHGNRGQHQFLAVMMAVAACYILFMVTINVPMYWSRWQMQVATGHSTLPLLQGLADASRSCVVSFEQTIWHQEIPWMTLYFTTVVWVSILLPHAPMWQHMPPGQSPTESASHSSTNA